MRVVVSESPRYVDFLYETPEGSGNTAIPPSPWKSPTTPYAHIVVPSVKSLCAYGDARPCFSASGAFRHPSRADSTRREPRLEISILCEISIRILKVSGVQGLGSSFARLAGFILKHIGMSSFRVGFVHRRAPSSTWKPHLRICSRASVFGQQAC